MEKFRKFVLQSTSTTTATTTTIRTIMTSTIAADAAVAASSSSSSNSKFTSPPSIANYQRHEEWINQMKEMVEKQSAEKTAKITKSDDDSNFNLNSITPSNLPLKLQAYANQHCLKSSMYELELQKEIEYLPMAGMAGAPDESNLLCLLLEMMNAKIVIEVGVFRGTTTLAMAQCLKGLDQKDRHDNEGKEEEEEKNNNQQKRRKVIALDVSSDYVEIGQRYWKQAGVEDFIDLRIGDAKESLSNLLEEKKEKYGENSVDLCFIDADKTSYDDYYEKCLSLTKSGGLIVVDNTLWGGRVITPNEVLHFLAEKASNHDLDDKSDEAIAAKRAKDTLAIKALADKVYQDDRIERVAFLTIADGVTICRKK